MEDMISKFWETYKECEREGFLRSYDSDWWNSESPPESFYEFMRNPGLSGCFVDDYDEEVFAWLHIIMRTAMKLANLGDNVEYSIFWEYPTIASALVVLYDRETMQLYAPDGEVGFSLNDFVDAPFTDSELAGLVYEIVDTLTSRVRGR